MPRVVFTASAVRGLSRCIRFLHQRDRDAARRAAQTIDERFALLRTNPMIGRLARERPAWRELVIQFGGSGYVALYRYDLAEDTISVLAFRHQKEAGY